MATKKSTAMVSAPSEETVAMLGNLFPTEIGYQRAMLPRLGMFSQDKYEKDVKTKEAKLIKEAGMFFVEVQDEEETKDETTGESKRLFRKTELGTEPIEGTIIYIRKQLSYYEEATDSYTSSPIYDEDDEIIPLWCNKAEVARGTPAELKAMYPGKTAKGKDKSNLDDNRILYVLFQGPADDEPRLYQLNLRGTSLYSFKDYRKTVRPNMPSVLTAFSSEPMKKGDLEWNKMTFSKVRDLSKDEITTVVENVTDMVNAIKDEKSQFSEQAASDKEWAEKTKALEEANK